MATAPYLTSTRQRAKPFVERWFITGMAIVMLVVSLAGFLPAIVNPAGRHAPLTLLAAAQGMVFLAWLLLFLAQSLLAAKRHIR
jgi:zinc transporter ZupT